MDDWYSRLQFRLKIAYSVSYYMMIRYCSLQCANARSANDTLVKQTAGELFV